VKTKGNGFGLLQAELVNTLVGFSFIFLHLHLYSRICILLLIEVSDVDYSDNLFSPFHLQRHLFGCVLQHQARHHLLVIATHAQRGRTELL